MRLHTRPQAGHHQLTATTAAITIAGINPNGTGTHTTFPVPTGTPWAVTHEPFPYTGEPRWVIHQTGAPNPVYTHPAGTVYVGSDILAIHPGPANEWEVNWANDVLTRTGNHWETPTGDVCIATGDGTWPLHVGLDRTGRTTHLYVLLHHQETPR